ncbi:uncharacterized protein LOC144432106 [Styela clava]
MNERLEDAFTEVVKKFTTIAEFKDFAQSRNGLKLSVRDVTTITENHRFAVEEQEKRILWLWAERNGANANPQSISNIVTQYYGAEHLAIPAHEERLEDVFPIVIRQFKTIEFKNFARSGQGLSLDEHEVDIITENNKFSVEERNLKLLWRWRNSRQLNADVAAVIERIRQLVDEYIHGLNKAEEAQTIHENNQAENEQIIQPRMVVESTSEISESLCESTLPIKVGETSGLFEKKQMKKEFSSPKLKSLRISSEAKEDAKSVEQFLIIVENFMKQKLELRLKSVKEKTKMDDFILPKISEFKESDSKEQTSDTKKHTSLQPVDITKIHSDNSVNHVMLLGDTGSGKSTFALRYTMLASEKKLVFSEEIKMVYLVEISKLQCDKKSTAFDLLFIQQLGSKFPKSLHNIGQEWLSLNSKHVVLVFDGLDQIKKPFENEYGSIGEDTPAETNTIIANILSGHIYPEMKVLSTSRWHVYWKLPPSLKAASTLALGGWDDETLNLLAEKVFGSEAKRFIYALKEKAQCLVSNPMFFFYMVRVLKNSEESDVGTLTNLMVCVLKLFSTSSHKRDINRLVLQGFMKLAYHGMIENRFDFTASYIESLNLDMKDMRGLVEMDADTEFVEYVPDDDDMRLRFSHQSIQEILASLYVCNLGLDEFKKFINDNYSFNWFYIFRMEVVIKHIFGIILNKSTSEKAKNYLSGNLHIKSEYLLDKLLGGKVILYHSDLTFLHECGPDVIKKVSSQIKKVDLNLIPPEKQRTLLTVVENLTPLENLKLGHSEIHPEIYSLLLYILGSVQSVHVRCLDLIKCGPDAEKVCILIETAMKGNLKIGCFSISKSPALEPLGYFYAVGLAHHCETYDIVLNNCDLNAEKISEMIKAVDEYGMYTGIFSLEISGENPNMDEEAFTQLAKLLRNIGQLYLTLTSKQLSALCTSLENENVKLSVLSLSKPTTEPPTNDELLILARLAPRMELLSFSDPGLSDSQLAFLETEIKKVCPTVWIEHFFDCFEIHNPDAK